MSERPPGASAESGSVDDPGRAEPSRVEPGEPGSGDPRTVELREAAATARRRITIMAVVTLLAASTVWGATPLGALHSGYLAVLLLLLPALAVAQVPLADAEETLPRIPTYVGSGVVILTLGATSLAIGSGHGATALGLAPRPVVDTVVQGTLIAAAALALMAAFKGLAELAGWSDAKLLDQLLPRTGREKAYFVGLSFAAGIGEELAYRAYAMATLQLLVGPWSAAAISSVSFGVLHSYQGALGIVRTGIIGAVLAASFVTTGSVWPAIVAHVLIDLVAGLLLGDRMLSRGPERPPSS